MSATLAEILMLFLAMEAPYHMSRYFEAMRTVLEGHGGTVEKFIGDAVMAVWGTPTATEDDAERFDPGAVGRRHRCG